MKEKYEGIEWQASPIFRLLQCDSVGRRSSMDERHSAPGVV